LGVLALLGHELGVISGAPRELAAVPKIELDIMKKSPEWDFPERKSVTRPNLRATAGKQSFSDPKS
jgi:hypothetical protein